MPHALPFGSAPPQSASAPSAPDIPEAPADSLPRYRSVSCVIPCYNEADNLSSLLEHLEEVLFRCGVDWEIVVVDDGSTDQTAAIAREWSRLSGFRFLSLSRNFGKEAALTAGLTAAHGEAVILLDGDHQHSPELVSEMIARWRDGADVVYTVREKRSDEAWIKRVLGRVFYRIVQSDHRYDVTRDAGDFRLMDRKVVDALLSLPERARFMKGLYAWIGFKTVAMPYMPAPRAAGQSAYSFFRLLSLGFDGLTSFTTWPLRVVSIVGVAVALPAMGYGFYLLIDYLVHGNAVSGWSTLAVTLLFFMGLQMIFTGLLGEYVARIFDEVKGRPLYLVAQEGGSGLEKAAG